MQCFQIGFLSRANQKLYGSEEPGVYLACGRSRFGAAGQDHRPTRNDLLVPYAAGGDRRDLNHVAASPRKGVKMAS